MSFISRKLRLPGDSAGEPPLPCESARVIVQDLEVQTLNQAPLSHLAPASERPLRREIVRLAWPIFAESMSGTLTQMVDMMLVAPLGAGAVAAVGLSTQPLWFLMAPFFGLAAGVGALVSRFVGANDPEQASATGRQGLLIGLGVGLLMGLLIYWQAGRIILLMGGQVEVLPQATAYLRSLAPGLAFLFISIILNGVSRAAGDTRTPFYIGGAVNLLNLVLAWALIYGRFSLPALGLVGAGTATSVARILGGVGMFLLLWRGTRGVTIKIGKMFHVDLDLIKRILNVGLPAAGERVATSFAYVVYARIVSSLGTVAVAAHYTAVIAENVAWMLGTGLTAAAATLVGQSLGAGDTGRAHRVIKEAARVGAVAALPLILLFAVLPATYLQLFTQDPVVLDLATLCLRVAALGEIPMIVSLVFLGALTGAGDSRVPALVSLLGGWVIRLGLAALFVFGFGWGLGGAWAASVVDWSVRLGLLVLRYRSGVWQLIRV